MKFKTFCKEHRSFFGALGLLLIALLLVMDCALFKIKPVIDAEPGYGRILLVYRLVMILLLALTGILAFLLFVKKDYHEKSRNKLSVIIVAVLGMVYIFVMPPLSAPDEIRHYLTAYRISNQMMFADNVADNGEVYMRAEDAELLFHDFPGRDDYYKLFEKKNWIGTADTTVVKFTDEKAGEGFFVAYLPQAFGITLGRLLGLKQIPLMMLARVFSLISFLFFFYLSLKIIPFGREVLLAITCMPMVIEEITAVSYDVLLIALAFYFVAYVLHLTYTAEQVRAKDMIILTISMAILAPIKLVYVFMAFLMFLIPKAKFGNTKRYLASAVAMALVIATIFLLSKAALMGEYVAGTNTELSYAEQGSYTLGYLIAHPLNTIRVFMNSLSYWPGILIMDMVGSRMGWQDVILSDFLIVSFIVILFMAAIKPAEEATFVTTRHRVSLWTIFAVVSLMIGLSMLVGITPLGEMYIWGIQGRYFVPLLPLTLAAIRGGSIRRSLNTNKWIMYGLVLLNIWAVCEMIGTVVSRLGVMKLLVAS